MDNLKIKQLHSFNLLKNMHADFFNNLILIDH
jgi:hypothetical protein